MLKVIVVTAPGAHILSKAAILLIAVFPLAAAQRDYWLKSDRNGTPFAWEHITVTDLPDGNLRYDYSNEIRVGMNGISDMRETSSFVVDRELRPVSYKHCVEKKGTKTCAEGVRDGDTLEVRTARKSRKFDVREFYFEAILPDLIVRNSGRRQFRVRLLDCEKGELKTSSITIRNLAADSIEASLKEFGFTNVYTVSRDGRIRELRIDSVGVRSYPADAGNAQRIATLKDSLLGSVRTRNPFPNAYTVTSARVHLRWIGLPVSELKLNDNRQRLVSTAPSGDFIEATVDLAPQQPAQEGSRPQLAYLRDDDQIKPGDPGIRRHAAEVASATKDPATIVQSLLRWVYGYIRYELRSDILTGPEILEKRTGRCAEYAVLFASLARAAGIPTRIVVGFAYHDGLWEGHMWNEVWLAQQWIAVDAALASPVTAPLHLKFVDSPTVNGAMATAKKIFHTVQVDIVDFQEAGLNPALKTGIRGLSYTNASYHCRVSAPDDSWEMKEHREDDGTLVLSMIPKPRGARFALMLFAVPSGADASVTLEKVLKATSNENSSLQVVEREEIELAKRRAAAATFVQTDADGGGMWNRNVVLIAGNCAYLFMSVAPKSEFDRLTDAFQKVLASFELIR